MEPTGGDGDGEIAAKIANPSSSGGEDRLSALPDEIIVLILLHLPTAEAARTRVLSRRWRRIWPLLPELRFPEAPEPPQRLRAILEAHEAALRYLHVGTRGAAPDPLAAWLPAAARRLTGCLVLQNVDLGQNAEGDGEAEAALELPCFERATAISLDLGFLRVDLPLPRAGVFARLTELNLLHVRFRIPWLLGDVVSWWRCPCLQKLMVSNTWGLDDLSIQSKSLLRLEMTKNRGLRRLSIWAPELKDLWVLYCFFVDKNQPVVTISTPQLVSLNWWDAYDPSSFYTDKMEHLRSLSALYFRVYGPHGSTHNQNCLRLLWRFKVIESLFLALVYPPAIDNYQYLMEDMTILPHIKFLHLTVLANGHAFGASSFHVLRLCSGITRLKLEFRPSSDFQAHTCQSGCNCDEQPNWEAEELLLNHLQEVEITELSSEREVAFVRRLFNWAKTLKKMTVTFQSCVTESMVKEFHQVLRSFSRPEICMEFHWYKDRIKLLYAPID
ncbi:hypothetical protein ACP70R_015155 [Stipagrostis hirtigluma subsp. patula]